jgi:hypothetical protein
MGDWKVISTAGTGSVPTVPDAPNVLNTGGTLTTATAVYGLIGNASAYQITGSISLDMGNAHIAHLKKIHVVYSVTGLEIATLLQPNGGWVSSPVAFSSDWYFQDGTAHTGTLKFYCENEDANQTAGPVSISVTVQASAVTSVSASEVGPTFTKPEEDNRLVYTWLSFVPVFNGGQVPQFVTYLVSADNGATYTHIGPARVDTVGQAVTFYRPSPASSVPQWKVAAAAGFWAAPSVAVTAANVASIYGPGVLTVVSAGFTVAGLSVPANNLITALTVPAGAGGSWPYNSKTDDSGRQFWAIEGIEYSDVLAAAAPADFTVIITATNLDASHNPVEAQILFGDVQVSRTGNPHVVRPVLMGEYGTAGFGHARSGPIAFNRLEVYISSRIPGYDLPGAYLNPLIATKQTGIGGGAGYVDVPIAAGGALPPAGTDARRIDPSTWGPGLIVNPSTNMPEVGTVDDPLNMLVNPRFDSGMAGWTTGPGTAWHVASGGGALAPQTATLNGGGSGIFLLVGQLFNTRPGKSYHLSMLYRVSALLGSQAYIAVNWLDNAGGYIGGLGVAPIATSGWQQPLGFDSGPAPAGAAHVMMWFGGVNIPIGQDIEIDSPRAIEQVATGPGMQPDGAGGVAVKTGNGLGLDGSDNVVVKPGNGLGFDAFGNAIVKTANGLGISVGGAVVPLFGATVGLNGSGQLVVPSSSLGLAEFGGVYQPYGFYFGLPSPTGAGVPKIIINTVDWKIYRNTGSAWTKAADPADIVTGTITALVSMISPVIAGGSISGATLSLNANGVTVTIDNHAFGGSWAGLEIQNNSTGNAFVVTSEFASLYNTNPVNGKLAVGMGQNSGAGNVTVADGSGAGGLGSGRRILLDGSNGHLTVTGGHFDANSAPVLSNRRTGWSTWSGTASRGSVNTAFATLQNVAEALKALIDDLHNAAGHGIIGT